MFKGTRGELAELKALSKPPEYVQRTLDAVLILFDEPIGWQNAYVSILRLLEKTVLFFIGH